MEVVHSWQLSIADAQLQDLRERLIRTRFPDQETVPGWGQGVPLDHLKRLITYWVQSYDWRRCERKLNDLGLFSTFIDGLQIRFLHIRSPHDDALPMILTHGWPGSIIEFLKVIEPLSNPGPSDSNPQAFHLVIPCLPGFGFSEQPREGGWGVERIARTWGELMRRLGYDHYVAQGGDWGSIITTHMAAQSLPGLLAIHLNMISAPAPKNKESLTAEDVSAIEQRKRYHRFESAYALQQGSRPQTLGYGLADSPAGQAAWIYEKLRAWSDCNGAPETVFSFDQILDNVMLYWLPNASVSSARLYYESYRTGQPFISSLPVAISNFPEELYQTPRSWADQLFGNIVYWEYVPRGGHFAAFEQPELFVEQLRKCFTAIR